MPLIFTIEEIQQELDNVDTAWEVTQSRAVTSFDRMQYTKANDQLNWLVRDKIRFLLDTIKQLQEEKK